MLRQHELRADVLSWRIWWINPCSHAYTHACTHACTYSVPNAQAYAIAYSVAISVAYALSYAGTVVCFSFLFEDLEQRRIIGLFGL